MTVSRPIMMTNKRVVKKPMVADALSAENNTNDEVEKVYLQLVLSISASWAKEPAPPVRPSIFSTGKLL